MRLGEMLMKAGVVTELQLHAAVAEQNRWGGKLGQILVRMGALSEELLVLALCRQLSLPKADLDVIKAVPDALKERLDQATCERYKVLPLAYVQERKAVQLAMSDPFDVVALDDLARRLGTRIEAFLAGDQALSAAIRRLYGSTSMSTSMSGAVSSLGSMDFVDNSGNSLAAFKPPPADVRAMAPSAPQLDPPADLRADPRGQRTMPPLPAPPPTPAPQQMGLASLPARIDEQSRAVRAVAELLAERGFIPWTFGW